MEENKSNLDSKKEVNLYIKGCCGVIFDNRYSVYAAILSYNSNDKIVSGHVHSCSVPRIFLTGLLETIQLLKCPCLIKIHAPIKIKYMLDKSNKYNKDLKFDLQELITKNNHTIVHTISNIRQRELSSIIKSVY